MTPISSSIRQTLSLTVRYSLTGLIFVRQIIQAGACLLHSTEVLMFCSGVLSRKVLFLCHCPKVLISTGTLLNQLLLMIIKQDRDRMLHHGRCDLKVLSIVS